MADEDDRKPAAAVATAGDDDDSDVEMDGKLQARAYKIIDYLSEMRAECYYFASWYT